LCRACGWVGGCVAGWCWSTLEGCFGDPVASVLLVSTASSLVAGGHPCGCAGAVDCCL
jgi:hypothetical protein